MCCGSRRIRANCATSRRRVQLAHDRTIRPIKVDKKRPRRAGPKSREETPSRSKIQLTSNRSLDGCKYATSDQILTCKQRNRNIILHSCKGETTNQVGIVTPIALSLFGRGKPPRAASSKFSLTASSPFPSVTRAHKSDGKIDAEPNRGVADAFISHSYARPPFRAGGCHCECRASR